jgi:hypothetical protein
MRGMLRSKKKEIINEIMGSICPEKVGSGLQKQRNSRKREKRTERG